MTKYMEIANDIRNQIVKGILKPNEQLLFEKDLSKVYSSSKMTIKKALDILVAEGLIVKRRGSGTFVKSINSSEMDKLIVSNQFRGFSALYSGKKIDTEVLVFQVINCDEKIRTKLNLEEEQFVYNIVRVRSVDNVPYVIENTYMPINIIQGLKKAHANNSIYSFIEEDLGLKIQSSHRKISVRKSNTFEQEHLHLEAYDPVAIAEQVAYLENGTAFEYSISVHSYNYFSFETVIIR